MTTTQPEATVPAAPAADVEAAADALVEALCGSMLGAFDVLSIHLGDQLDLYTHLVGHALTTAELARRSGTDERYVREWCEQQTVSGLLAVDDVARSAAERRYTLPPGHAEVLADRDSLTYLTPFFRVIASAAVQVPALLEAYRTGDGVSWAQYGDDMRTGQGEANRALFLHEVGRSWIPAVPDAHEVLSAGGRVADVGCGEGWSSIALALAYPHVRIDGVDVDPESVEAARQHAAAHGVQDRVAFHIADAARVVDAGSYDLVTAFECIHDLADPVAVLGAMRRLAKPGAPVLVMDERVAERFTGEDDFVERLMYGMSLFVCLPDGRSHSPSAATGTVMRPDTLRGYAHEAGFAGVDVLDIDHDLFRFYLLRH